MCKSKKRPFRLTLKGSIEAEFEDGELEIDEGIHCCPLEKPKIKLRKRKLRAVPQIGEPKLKIPKWARPSWAPK